VEGVLAKPEAYEAYLCFHAVAQASGDWDAAEARLGALSPRLPFDGWALLMRGHLTQVGDEPRSIDFYQRAAAAFARQGLARGEILARHNLRNLFHRRGESEAAAAQVVAAVSAAERAGEPGLRAQALVLRGTHQVETGGDLASAQFDLRRALDLLADGGPYAQRKLAFLALANAAFQLGRYDEAVATYRRLLDLTRAERDAGEEATALFNIANARQRQFEDRPRPDALARLEPIAMEALAAARRAGNRGVEIRAGALLGQIAQGRGDAVEARQRFEAALGVARRLGHPERVMICLWLLSELLAESDVDAARAHIDEATALALATENDRHLVYAWQAGMRLAWRTRPRAEAIESARHALGAIEALAARQGDEAANVGIFGAWARDYRWLAGRQLDGDEPDLGAAFATMERMRGRALLAALAAPRKGGTGGAEGTREAAVRQELIAIQRRLLAAGDAAASPALADELERKELELAALRAAPAPGAPGDSTTAHPAADLEGVRAALGPGEVLVLYQLAPRRDLYGRFAGGSWVVTISAERARVDRLPELDDLEPMIAAFLGLIARRDGSEAAAARRLYDLLLGASLADLTAPPARLIFVPDGALFDLPFELLRASVGDREEPLGVRAEIAVAPSAAAWLHWRAARAAAPERSALVLADPAIFSPPAAQLADLAAPEPAAALGPLPGARAEGRHVARRLRPTSEVLVGAAASEGALQRGDLGSFAILHLAAHAVADSLRPQRSAVHLAAASAAEDGLLQAREIAQLPLGGRLVVLSACRSAAGSIGEGEGPMSLARAFQQAGARAVVASRWRLRDDEAETMVRELYDRLAAGERLGAAMRAVRAAAWSQRRPAASWGAFVLLGEADFPPLAGVEIEGPSSAGIRIALTALAVVLLAGIAVRAARRSARPATGASPDIR
jgi:CHAT domain-containing protein/tetratricopeptide (TPR) repeat protein